MKGKIFTIVIPAYNEEEAVAGIITRCLAARQPICDKTGLSSVEILVVDDGSRDGTRGIAEGFSQARLVVHPFNKGYGRALMTGFENAKGDYLGFLDADGTCDPLAFIDLFEALEGEKADMAVGNRLHEGSRMPAIRFFGNRVYAWIISRLTGISVRDSASGMRVFTRELLPRLKPLPAGLHFTPAMTARVASMGGRIAEAPIPYAERQGRSKLNVFADGLRFLSVILGVIFSYFPLRIFGPLGGSFAALAFLLGLKPLLFYFSNRRLEEDVIYRLLTVSTLAVCGLICLAFGLLAQRVSDAATGRSSRWADGPWLGKGSVAAGGLLAFGGVLLNAKTIMEYASSGHITTPWVYVLTGGLAVILGTVLVSFGITLTLVGHLPSEKTATSRT